MTEAEWLASDDAGEMLPCLLNEHGANRRKLGRRRLRLFGCASCRLLCDPATDPRSLVAIETLERFTEGGVEAAEMVAVEEAAHRALMDSDRASPAGINRSETPGHLAAQAAFHLVAKHGKRADWCAWAVFRTSAHYLVLPGDSPDPVQVQEWSDRLRAMAGLLRDIVGNPFRPVALPAALRTSTVRALAQTAYDERDSPTGHLDSDRLAVFSDALEDAGCADAELLSHLRSPGPHVRGCWALDLVLGKQ